MSSRTPSSKIASVVQPDDHEQTSRVLVCLGALLAYLPFGWWIADAYPTFAIIGGVAAVGVAGTPDTLTGIGLPKKWTHSVVGAVFIGSLLAAAGWWFGSEVSVFASGYLVTPLAAAKYTFAIGCLSVCGHLFADGFTGTDVSPFWPISGRDGSIDLLPLIDIQNNNGFNIIGTVAVVALISSLLTAMVLPL
jgi:hypothetical protein